MGHFVTQNWITLGTTRAEFLGAKEESFWKGRNEDIYRCFSGYFQGLNLVLNFSHITEVIKQGSKIWRKSNSK
jgi:hypothetical protein